MRHTKMLGLAFIAAAALMAITGPASATTVTTTTGGAAATPTIHFVNEGGHVSLANNFAPFECSSTLEATIKTHGAGVTATASIDKLQFTGCTTNWTVTVNSPGTLELHWTSGHNGTATSTGLTMTAILHTQFGNVTCRFSTYATHLGTITGGNPATLHIEGSIPFHSGGGLCGEGVARLTGSLVTTGPLYIENASPLTLTSPTGTATVPSVHLANEGGHISIANSNTNIECSSTLEATLEPDSSGKATGPVSALSFSGCTNGWTVSVEAAGELEIQSTAGYDGTITSTGATLTAVLHTFFGDITCRYQTSNTDLGIITGGNPATLHIEGKLPFHSGGSVCGSGSAQMDGQYASTSSFYVDGPSGPPVAVTSPTGTATAPSVHLANEGGHISIANPNANIECSSTLEATLDPTADGTAAGPISALSFTGCTNGWTVSVVSAGELILHSKASYNGTATSNGMTLKATLHTFFGDITCEYKTSETDIGTITGGNSATLHIEGKLLFHSGSGLCGTEPAQMAGKYIATSALYFDK
jgi:hypothetical protein